MTRKGITYTLRFHYGRASSGAYKWKKVTAKTKAEARRKKEEFEILTGIADKTVITRQTFLSYLLNWGETFYKNSVKEQTYVGFLNALESRIKPYFIAQLEVSNIKIDVLQRYIGELIEAGYSRDTIKKTWCYIRNCLECGAYKGELKDIKLNLIELPNESNVRKKKKTVLPFSEGDVRKIEKESMALVGNKRKYYYGDIIIFLINTGLRIGEALALTWNDIDFKNGYIYVNKSSEVTQDKSKSAIKRTKEVVGSVKTAASVRRVVINKTASTILKSVFVRNAGYNGGMDRVILSSRFTIPSRRNISRCLGEITKNAGTDLKTSSLHVLRHTYATMFLRKGVPVAFISKQLGHAQETTTRNIYISYLDEAFDNDRKFFENF